MDVVNRIKALCEKQSISIRKLEKTIGLGKSTISRWDINSPSVAKVIKVAKYFHVSVDYLLGLTDDTQPRIPVKQDTEDTFRYLTNDERAALKAFLKAYREQKKKN